MPAPALPPSVLVQRLRTAGCVFVEEEAELLLAAATTPVELADLLALRVAGLPLEQVLGWAHFCGLRIAVEPGVFVPRRRTEFLVATAAALVRRAGAVVLDLCCGSGAVGAALAAAAGPVELHAADLDATAVGCARRNLAAAGGQVHEGDLFEPLPADLQGRVDVLVVNAPYVPTDAVELMPPEARVHEPRLALDGGPDGLDVQRRVVAQAPRWLAPGGTLLIETSERQAPQTAAAFSRAGLRPRVLHSPAQDATVVLGAADLTPPP